MWPHYQQAREAASNIRDRRITVDLKADKLIIINHHIYTFVMLPRFLRYSRAQSIHQVETDDVTLFFTKSSPLSNFHQSEFHVNEQRFNCVEQYIMFNKALLFEEKEIAQDILHLDDPKLQKLNAKDANLKKFDSDIWKEKAGEILKTALMAKFQQNSNLQDELLHTGETILADASPTDKFFGIGLSINNPKAVNKSCWRDDNLQGTALMSVRDQLKLV